MYSVSLRFFYFPIRCAYSGGANGRASHSALQSSSSLRDAARSLMLYTGKEQLPCFIGVLNSNILDLQGHFSSCAFSC